MTMLNIIFLLITLLSFILFHIGAGSGKRGILISILWLAVTGTLAYLGFYENTSSLPPRFLFVLLPGILIFTFQYKWAKKARLNITSLLAIHALRLPVELILHQLYLQKKIPILMTYEGWNFDILTGMSAILLLAYKLFTGKELNRSLMILWNLTGLALLLIIVSIAILSAPLPIQQLAFDQPNIAVLEFPIVFLPAYIVPAVFVSHVLLIQKEMKKK